MVTRSIGYSPKKNVGFSAVLFMAIILVYQWRFGSRIFSEFTEFTSVAAEDATITASLLDQRDVIMDQQKNGAEERNLITQETPIKKAPAVPTETTKESKATSIRKRFKTATITSRLAKTNSRLETFNSTQTRTSPVLVATYVFGQAAVSARRFRMFVASAKYCGFDIVIVGDTLPPFALPPNVHHFQISWPEFADRVYERVLDGKGNNGRGLHKAGFYKVCDFKPLFAHLFPEVVAGYEWWGHCDNDLILGNLTKFFPYDPMLKDYDIVSGDGTDLTKHQAWGPFTLYRNIPLVNTLWKKIELDMPLSSIFGDRTYHFFDEWNNVVRRGHNYSMTGMIKRYAKDMGIRHTYESTVAFMNDKDNCKWAYKKGNAPPRCAECTFSKGKLMYLTSHLKEQVPTPQFARNYRLPEDREVYHCHYQGSKKKQEPSLSDTQKFQDLLQDEAFRVSYAEGFDYYDLEDPRRKVQQSQPITQQSSQ